MTVIILSESDSIEFVTDDIEFTTFTKVDVLELPIQSTETAVVKSPAF